MRDIIELQNNENIAIISTERYLQPHLPNFENLKSKCIKLKVGDEIGGHFVYGHVDCLGELSEIHEDKNSNIYIVKYPKKFSKFIVEKGSVSLDGISLTVNQVNDNEEPNFSVNIIPHTKEFTTWSDIAINSKINLEVDSIARYVLKSK